MDGYKINKQVFLNGRILGVGTYSKDNVGDAGTFIEAYCSKQKDLPLEQRDIPLFFELITGNKDSGEAVDKVEKKLDGYVSMNFNQLKELCKQRGLEVKGNIKKVDLIKLLNEDDKNVDEANQKKKFSFKSGDDFLELDSDAQVEYLDEIFSLPDDIEEGSADEEEYIGAMTEAVAIYSGLSLDEKVVDKVREIVDWANSEE